MASQPISIDEARERIVAAARAAAAVRADDRETVAVGEAHGRVLAQNVTAAHDVPPFPSSAMDGFALHVPAQSATLRVQGESRAGHPAAGPLTPGTAMRISTGAAVPAGANAVVPVEAVRESFGEIELHSQPAAGDHIRAAGEDMHSGETVLSAGTRIGPAEIGVAVGAGAGVLWCAARPRVALVATGDELRAPGEPLEPGQIHNSNALVLAAQTRRAGAAVLDPRRASDTTAGTVDALEWALDAANVVIATGGVSVGEHDHVKPAMVALGVEEVFWRVALRPGKPTWFGTREDTLAFGLPGNPVSAAVTFALFVEPALAALQGADPGPRRAWARLATPLPRRSGRTEAVRVSLTHDGPTVIATPTGAQGSHVTRSMLGADALALIEPGDGEVGAGEIVTVLAL